MRTSSSRIVAIVAGLCFALGIGIGRAAPEKIPPDKVIHPLLKGVSQPELLPESRKNPPYPERWRETRLGAQVILQGVIEKTGSVGEIAPLKTKLWVVADCDKASGDAADQAGGEPGATPPGGSTKPEPAKPAAPAEAGRDFEAAALKAVKQWKYRPGNMNGVPVDVYTTIIVEFTPCPDNPEKKSP